MLSNQASRAPQRGQRLGGETTLSPLGSRYITTLRKDPAHAPKANRKASPTPQVIQYMVVIEKEPNLVSSWTRPQGAQACRQGSYIGSAGVVGRVFTGNFIDSKRLHPLLGFTEDGLAPLDQLVTTLVGGQ